MRVFLRVVSDDGSNETCVRHSYGARRLCLGLNTFRCIIMQVGATCVVLDRLRGWVESSFCETSSQKGAFLSQRLFSAAAASMIFRRTASILRARRWSISPAVDPLAIRESAPSAFLFPAAIVAAAAAAVFARKKEGWGEHPCYTKRATDGKETNLLLPPHHGHAASAVTFAVACVLACHVRRRHRRCHCQYHRRRRY